MIIQDYIKSKTTIKFNQKQLDYLTNEVMCGSYTFQLIYDEYDDCIKIIKLNSRKVKKKKYYDSPLSACLYSIDGGVRYQWSEKEILIIDIDIIRDIKLNSLFNFL